MRIISLIRNDINIDGAPTEFTVGDGPEGNVVDKIVAQRAGQSSFYPEPCYFIHFVGSTVRRIVPLTEVKDMAYDTAKEQEEKAPELPEE